MKTIYKETIGPATIELIDNQEMNTSYTVKLTDNAGTRQANVISYETALAIYDNTTQQAARLYNVKLAPIGTPDFIATVTK